MAFGFSIFLMFPIPKPRTALAGDFCGKGVGSQTLRDFSAILFRHFLALRSPFEILEIKIEFDCARRISRRVISMLNSLGFLDGFVLPLKLSANSRRHISEHICKIFPTSYSRPTRPNSVRVEVFDLAEGKREVFNVYFADG